MAFTIRELAAYFSSRWRATSDCEACGQVFSCGATLAGCWCSEIKLSDATRISLASRYRRCLCRTCLKGLGKADSSLEKNAVAE